MEADLTAGFEFYGSVATAPEISLTPSQADRPWSACRRPWTLVYVTVHGNVLPCCIAPWITDHYEGIILGTLSGQRLLGGLSDGPDPEFATAIIEHRPHD